MYLGKNSNNVKITLGRITYRPLRNPPPFPANPPSLVCRRGKKGGGRRAEIGTRRRWSKRRRNSRKMQSGGDEANGRAEEET